VKKSWGRVLGVYYHPSKQRSPRFRARWCPAL